MERPAIKTTYRVVARRTYGGTGRVAGGVKPITVTVTIEDGTVRTDGNQLDPLDVVREAVEHLLPAGFSVGQPVELVPSPVRLSRKQDGA